jgi:signal transduction histidine kinase|tara:strand:+ start:97 stop:1290 length:1194 start_codon:yes stop_codon:yes gene_type:complete
MIFDKFKVFIPIILANLFLFYFLDTKEIILFFFFEILLILSFIYFIKKSEKSSIKKQTDKKENKDLTLSIYESFIDKLDNPIFIIGKDFKIISQNLKSQEIYEDQSSNDISTIIRDYDFIQNLDEYKKNNEFNRFTWSKNLPDRKIFNTEILNFSEFLIIIITDITNQKLIEEKQTVYLDDLTHELKTPLSTIIGYLETIDFNNYTIEENKNFLKIINSKTFEIKNLIDQILKLSETNIANKEILKINIQEILKSTIASYDNLFKKSGISFQIDIESANNKVTSFTSMELEVVINNLLSNALKYTPKGKTVSLKTKITSKNDLSIIIQDQGIGIPQKDLSRLTERFFRVDQSRNNQTGGHGLGLTIANHILSKNGCVLEISSELGKGSIFKFNLKLS